MATTFPTFILLKSFGSKRTFFCYYDDFDGVSHSITVESETELGAFNALAKIELEPAKINSKYVHLRFFHNNRYFAVNNAKDLFVLAGSKKPEEDRSKLSCTLFEPIRADNDDGSLYLIHVHTGWRVQIGYNSRLLLDKDDNPSHLHQFSFVDWDTIVKLPEHVAFKGDNGKYLQAHWRDNLPFLQFSSDDAYAKSSGFRVELRPDGYVRIKSDYFGKFWSLSPSWIWADESRDWHPYRLDDAFWPIKIDGSTIALRNGVNNRYCARLSVDRKTDCLNAAVSTATKEARLVVEELVQERHIYGVIYRMENMRIFDEMPYVAGKTVAYNKGDREGSIGVELTYQNEKSYSFNRGFSITGGVKTSIKAGAAFIAEGKVEVSLEITGNFEWGTTTTTTESIKATGTVPVPARSMAVVHYVGTKGTCNIPYSYTQQDRSSSDGKIVYTKQNDGMYTGVSCYNFQFVIDKAQPI